MPSFLNRRPAGRGLRGLFNRILLGLVLLVSQGLVPDLLGQNFYRLEALANLSTARVNAGRQTGMGVAIGDGYILITCAHVVGNHKTVDIESGFLSWEGEVLATSEKDDVAIIRMDRRLTPAKISSSTAPLAPNSFIMASGRPEGQRTMDMRPGTVIRQCIDGDFLVTAKAKKGYSGGPVFNENGTLIGLMRGFASHKQSCDSMEVISSYKIVDLVNLRLGRR